MIEAIELTSTRRSRGAGCGPVENVSFDVYPGQVTALLGAPGAGKSTVLRLMVELEPGGGRTLFGGRPYRALRPAVREVGLALNPDALHPGRTVQAHLQLYAAGGGVPKPRVAEVLDVAGLSTQATVRCGRLDAGQRQRLAIAAALLGDPAALILDEPHTLDSHGMSWFHALIRAYAAQGRTVLVAATDPDILSGTADHVVVLRRDEHDGISRVIASRSAAEVFEERRATVVQVRSPQAARLAAALESEGARLAPAGPGALQVRGLDRARIGEVAHVAGVCLHELSEIDHDDDVFGLRPVPRQKELLPGLTRTGGSWRAGVRVVATETARAEIEDTVETEAVEAAVEASAEAEGPERATEEAAVSATVQASTATVTVNGAPTPEPNTVAQFLQPTVGAQASEPGAKAQTPQPSSTPQAPEPTVTAQPFHQNVRTLPSEAAVATQASQASGAVQSPGSAVAAQALPRTGSQASESAQAADAADAADAQSPQAVPTDQQCVGIKPTTPGSWRTQGSVAGSRWSAVKGSQAAPTSAVQAPAAPAPAAPVPAVQALAAPLEPVPNAPEDPEPAPAISIIIASAEPAAAQSPAPAKHRDRPRRTSGFGFRWGRSKPQHSAAPASARRQPSDPSGSSVLVSTTNAPAPHPLPEPSGSSVRVSASPAPAPHQPPEPTGSPVLHSAVASPAPAPAPHQPPAPTESPVVVQPAVPFTIAPAVEQRAADDGMTPWRAAAARGSKQGQQQASVAEAAPAEQETSA